MMKSSWVLGYLQGFELDSATKPIPSSASLVIRDVAVVVGVILVLTVLLFVGARFYVKNRKHHHHERSGGGSRPQAEPGSTETAQRSHRHRHRRRRKRGDSRSRNPTLAETGGLPPLRARPEPKPPM